MVPFKITHHADVPNVVQNDLLLTAAAGGAVIFQMVAVKFKFLRQIIRSMIG